MSPITGEDAANAAGASAADAARLYIPPGPVTPAKEGTYPIAGAAIPGHPPLTKRRPREHTAQRAERDQSASGEEA